MRKSNLIIISVLLFLLSSNVKSQNAPVASMPSQSNSILIDSLMKVSNFEKYFIEYCGKIIDKAAQEKSWKVEIIKAKKENINYLKFKEETIYNWFAETSTEELKDLIILIQKINRRRKGFDFFISNPAIQSNMELYASLL